MEFSWSYDDMMRRFANDPSYYNSNSQVSARQSLAYSAMLRFDVKFDGESCEIPTYLLNEVTRIAQLVDEKELTIVLPLFVGGKKVASGADTILKFFMRYNYGRLSEANTPKGETYYGNNGIILDSDFNPLFISTIVAHYSPSEALMVKDEIKIHLHPSVFTDDTKIINKSLAKKGIAYYLSHSVLDRWDRNNLKYKIEIDDCSQFITKAKRLDLEHYKSEDFGNVLKENIDEVLTQISDDSRRNF